MSGYAPARGQRLASRALNSPGITLSGHPRQALAPAFHFIKHRISFDKKNSIGDLEPSLSLPKPLRVEALAARQVRPAARRPIISMLLHGGCGYATQSLRLHSGAAGE